MQQAKLVVRRRDLCRWVDNLMEVSHQHRRITFHPNTFWTWFAQVQVGSTSFITLRVRDVRDPSYQSRLCDLLVIAKIECAGSYALRLTG